MNFFQSASGFAKDIYENRSALYQLIRRDYKNRYIGSSLGFLWTIIQPFVMIFILWVVFTKGFRVGPINGTPFIAYLALGIIAWDFFAQTLTGSTNVFAEYSYLVKKINFRIATLPIIKIFSGLLIHAITIGIGIIILILSGVPFSWYWFQALYYLMASVVLLLGLSWITSSLQVFFRDIAQIVSIILQFGFWLTPIVWDFAMVPEKFRFLFKLNPMFYIVHGYRNSFIYHAPFWEQTKTAVYFWVPTLILLLIGVILFRKLRPHFADVL